VRGEEELDGEREHVHQQIHLREEGGARGAVGEESRAMVGGRHVRAHTQRDLGTFAGAAAS
jgi:hypothetical protein